MQNWRVSDYARVLTETTLLRRSNGLLTDEYDVIVKIDGINVCAKGYDVVAGAALKSINNS